MDGATPRAVLLALVSTTVWLAGCGADVVSKAEARHTFDAVNAVTNDVVFAARRSVEGAGGGALSVDVSADGAGGLSLDGTLAGGEGWTGTIELSGVVEQGYDAFGYELTVTFDQVVVDDTTLDGSVRLQFYVDGLDPRDLSANLSLGLGIAVAGELALSGADAGTAAIDYELDVRVSGFDVSFAASGAISGYDVSDWSSGVTWF